MAYYNICPSCGCNLDPGEKCDCKEIKAQREEFFAGLLSKDSKTGQYSFRFPMEDRRYA